MPREWKGQEIPHFMQNGYNKNPSKFYKFMIGELSGAWGHSCYGLQTTHLNKPGRVLSECRHGHISAPVLFEWGYNESCWERQAIGTFDNCWDESELFLKVWLKGVEDWVLNVDTATSLLFEWGLNESCRWWQERLGMEGPGSDEDMVIGLVSRRW